MPIFQRAMNQGPCYLSRRCATGNFPHTPNHNPLIISRSPCTSRGAKTTHTFHYYIISRFINSTPHLSVPSEGNSVTATLLRDKNYSTFQQISASPSREQPRTHTAQFPSIQKSHNLMQGKQFALGSQLVSPPPLAEKDAIRANYLVL